MPADEGTKRTQIHKDADPPAMDLTLTWPQFWHIVLPPLLQTVITYCYHYDFWSFSVKKGSPTRISGPTLPWCVVHPAGRHGTRFDQHIYNEYSLVAVPAHVDMKCSTRRSPRYFTSFVLFPTLPPRKELSEPTESASSPAEILCPQHWTSTSATFLITWVTDVIVCSDTLDYPELSFRHQAVM